MEQPWKLQNRWYFILLFFLIIGIILICLNPQLPAKFRLLSDLVRCDRWSVLFGIYLVSIVITHIIIFYTARLTAVLLDLNGPDKLTDLWSPVLVGICENIMYPTALIIDHSEFIGVWFAVKVAGQWVRWTGETDRPKDNKQIEVANEARRRFNRFLVGNSLSIMAAFATYGALKIWVLR
jgi:hypothetical protein